MTSSKSTFYFFTGIFYISLIIPCFDTYRIIICLHRIIIIIYYNQLFSTFLKIIEKKKHFGIVTSKTGKIFDKHSIYVFIQIFH